MRISSRFTALALALCLALAMLPGAALALSGTGTVGDPYVVTSEADLNEALGKAGGGVIDIQADITLTSVKTISSDSWTIKSSSGKTLTTGETDVFTVTGGTLTLGEGLTVNSSTSILWAKDGGNIIVEDATLTSNATNYALALANSGGSITVKAGAVLQQTGDQPALLAKGNGATITVNDGEVTANGNSAVGVENGATGYINGGTVTTNTTGFFAAAYAGGNASSTTATLNISGNAIINAPTSTSGTVVAGVNGVLDITGGTINAGQAEAVVSHEGSGDVSIGGDANVNGEIDAVNPAELSVTGGTFTEDPSAFVDDASNIPTAAVSNGAGTPTFVVGETQIEQAAQDIADAGGNPKVDVKEGNADLEGLPEGTTVSNSGSGDVKANGQDVSPGTPIVIQPTPAPGPVNPPSSGGSSGGSGNAATYRGNGRFSTTASGITRVKVDGQAVGFTAESGGFRLDTAGLTKGKHLITVEWGNSSFTTWFTYEGGVTMSVDMEIPKTGGAPMLAYAALALAAASGMLRRR